MTAILTPLHPNAVAERLKSGKAILVDIRDPDEFSHRHVAGALSRPLPVFEAAKLKIDPDRSVIFTCRTGMRTNANCARLAEAVEGEAYVLDGGIDAWVAAGLPVEADRAAPLEMNRQVKIAAGGLVALGWGLGVAAHPAFYALSALVGLGLLFAGVTGICGMAKVLALAPWNRSGA